MDSSRPTTFSVSPLRDGTWILLLAMAGSAVAFILFPVFVPDSQFYLGMATGSWAEVGKPFVDRVLMPLSAGFLHRTVGLEPFAAFLLLQVVALVIFLWATIGLVRVIDDGRLRLLAFLPVPLAFAVLASVYMPDFAHMAILAVILRCMAEERWLLAGVAFLPAMLVRDTTLALALVFIPFALWHRRFAAAAVTVAAVSVAMVLVRQITAESPGNIHDMPGLPYLAGKFAANLLHNYLGTALWTNTRAWCENPVIVIDIGHFAKLGRIEAVGICMPDPTLIATTFAWMFGVAGILLTVLARWGLRRGWRDAAPPPVIGFALVYGLLLFVLGPMSGKTVSRLVFYGWPAFLIALPWVLGRLVPSGDAAAWSRWVVLHLVTVWAIWALLEHVDRAAAPFVALGIGLGANLLAWRWRFRPYA